MPKVGMQPIRRQQLIQATLTAVDQVGMGDASIALIAKLAGVSNGIISHYFQDKNGLIAATAQYLMTVLSENVTARRHALEDSGDGGIENRKASEVMTANPKIARPGQLAAEALALMTEQKITQLFVLAEGDVRPLGVIHIHDCLRAGLA